MSAILLAPPLGGVEARDADGTLGCAVYDHGAHVFAWTPEGGRPVLWMSREAVLDGRAAIRGGVPICFPWFGGGPDGARKPAHGVARLARWRRVAMVDALEAEGRLSVEYRLDSRDAPPTPDFPQPWTAALRVDFARDYAQIDLDVANPGDAPLTVEAALHSYFSVGDVRRIALRGLDGASYLDKAPGAPSLEARQAGDVTFVGETDRIYHSRARVEIVDPVFERRIVIDKGGSDQTVVWNPWVAKAKAMADFGDDEWTGMVCVEAGAIGEGAIRLAPGASWKLWQRVAVQPGA